MFLCETKDIKNDSVQHALPQLEFENFIPGIFPKRERTPQQPYGQRARTERQLLPIGALKQVI